ncbi:hypothetical protein [Thermoflexus sp.]|uniref:hypothetical protein n=1 Tax=Thermoflexus sp. TaxID=1969742 RepID=UPI003A102AFD
MQSKYISTPFGFEYKQIKYLKIQEEEVKKWFSNLSDPAAAQKVLQACPADERIPINEVTLWEWSETVAALYIPSLTSISDIINQTPDIGKICSETQTIVQELYQRTGIRLFNDILNILQQIKRFDYKNKDLIENLSNLLDSSVEEVQKLDRHNQIIYERAKTNLQLILRILKRAYSALGWRLLSIRTNGLEYLLSANSIPDLLARRQLLVDAWNRVRILLEQEVGLEVYRDENGPIFVVPDDDKLLNKIGNNQKTLRSRILQEFDQGTVSGNPELALQGELIPELYLDSQPWRGLSGTQGSRSPLEELPPIAKNWKNTEEEGHLQREPVLVADPERIQQRIQQEQREHEKEPEKEPKKVCVVCGLRLQGPSPKARNRSLCDVCEKRRADRAKEWMNQLSTTIWIDEVSDSNGRVALIVGTFDLTDWLSGSLVCSLAVRDPDSEKGPKTFERIAKNPSFARLRRIWETTRRFWQEVCPTDKEFCLEDSVVGKEVGRGGPRLEIRGSFPHNPDVTLGAYHAYDLVLPCGIRMAVVLDDAGNAENAENAGKRFITCDNLKYLELKCLEGPTQPGRSLREILRASQRFEIEEPGGYGALRQVLGEIELSQNAKEIPNSEYIPAIPILAEPRTFMALVPADCALNVVEAIKAKYEREMGKVRNRLPLHLGIVFAHRYTPLRAILDAGRRMLRRPSRSEVWKVDCASKKDVKSDKLPDRFDKDKDGQYSKWIEIFLSSDRQDRKCTWYVPAMMGDGHTEDNWYPYAFICQRAKPVNRRRYFQSLNPWNSMHPWVVHVAELQPGDRIYFTPATLDWVWLDAASRRFEIAYDDQGRRRGLPRRPYLLDELEHLQQIWQILKHHLTTTQIYALVEAIESARERLGATEDLPEFRRLCRDILANAEWRKNQKGEMPWEAQGQDRDPWLKIWADYAARGWLADVIELHLQIMKEEV